MGTFTAVKYQEEPEEPVCHNVVGNGKRDGAKAERSYRMTICCNTSDDFFHCAKSLRKGLFGCECP